MMSSDISSCTTNSCLTNPQSPAVRLSMYRAKPAKTLLTARLQKCASSPNLLGNSKDSKETAVEDNPRNPKAQRPPTNLLPLRKKKEDSNQVRNDKPLTTKKDAMSHPLEPGSIPTVRRRLSFSRHSDSRAMSAEPSKRQHRTLNASLSEACANFAKGKSSIQPLQENVPEKLEPQTPRKNKENGVKANIDRKMSIGKDEKENSCDEDSPEKSKKTAAVHRKRSPSPPKRNSPQKPPPTPGRLPNSPRKPESSIPVDIECVRRAKMIAEQAMKVSSVIFGTVVLCKRNIETGLGWEFI